MRSMYILVVASVVCLACGSEQYEESSQLSGLSETPSDAQLAALFFGQSRTIGACDIQASVEERSDGEEPGLHFALSHTPEGSEEFSFEFLFNNRMSNRSLVDVEHTFFTRVPTSIVLEHVYMRTAPAYKYRVDAGIKDHQLENIRVRLFYGSHHTVLRDFEC